MPLNVRPDGRGPRPSQYKPSRRERRLVVYFTYQGMTQKKIADELGISRQLLRRTFPVELKDGKAMRAEEVKFSARYRVLSRTEITNAIDPACEPQVLSVGSHDISLGSLDALLDDVRARWIADIK